VNAIWMNDNSQPSKKYYFETEDGRRGECNQLSGLFELLIEPDYQDIEDISAKATVWILLLRRIAITLGQHGQKADVYDGIGKVFSNYEDDDESEFETDNIYVLDAWNEETTIASLISSDIIVIFEKNDSLIGYGEVSAKKIEGALPNDFKPPLERET